MESKPANFELPEHFKHVDKSKVVYLADQSVVYEAEHEGKPAIVKQKLHRKVDGGYEDGAPMTKMLRTLVANEIKALQKAQAADLKTPKIFDSDLKQHLIKMEAMQGFESAQVFLTRELQHTELRMGA